VTWAAFVKRAYQAARDWGIQPSEFWKMSPWEWWTEFESKMEAQKRLADHMGETNKPPAPKMTFTEDELERARQYRRGAKK